MEKRTPTERDRKPRFSDDADFSAFEPTRRPRRNRSPFEEFPRPCDLLRKRRFRLQTSADRRDGKTTQENIARLRQNLYFNESSRKKTDAETFSNFALPRRDAANVRAFCRRPFVPSVGRVPLKRRRALIPIAFPTSLSLSGRTFTTRFFSARRRTFRVRRRFVFEKSRSERNDFVDRQPLADKAFILRRFSFRRGVASDLSFKIVPNLDTTFIGLIE